MITLSEIDFDLAKSYWNKTLWVDRDIKPVSSMLYSSGYNMNVYNLEISMPVYLAIFNNNEMIAINSVFNSDDDELRSRGLYVNPLFRGQGLSSLLLNKSLAIGKNRNCKYCWTLPKKESFYAYEKVGFIKTSEWQTFDYGVNCYARYDY